MKFVWYISEDKVKAINLELVRNIYTKYQFEGREKIIDYYFDCDKVATIKCSRICDKLSKRLTDKEFLKELYNIRIDEIVKCDKWKEEIRRRGVDYFCHTISKLELDQLLDDIFMFEIRVILRCLKNTTNIVADNLEDILIDLLIINGSKNMLA